MAWSAAWRPLVSAMPGDDSDPCQVLSLCAFHAFLSLRYTLMAPCAGEAGSLAAETSVFARSLAMLYSNLTAPNLRNMATPDDLPYLKQVIYQRLSVLATPLTH